MKKNIEKQLEEPDNRRNSLTKKSEEKNSKEMKYVMVRTYSAGVFTGYLFSRNGKEVTLKKARRIWYWDGANSLSELAMKGTTKPNKCKFPIEVEEILLTECIEIIPITKEAKKSIENVPIWSN